MLVPAPLVKARLALQHCMIYTGVMETKEEWRDIVGAEGIYEASSLGRIRRVKAGCGTQSGRVLIPHMQNQGRLTVNLSLNGVHWRKQVHHFIAEAFLGPRQPGYEINHKDGDYQNNAVSNLEWVTGKQNIYHAWYVLGKDRHGENCPCAKLTEAEVVDIRKMRSNGFRLRDIAESFGVSISTIQDIITRRTWRLVS